MKHGLLLVSLLVAATGVSAKDFLIDQKDKQFSQKSLKIKAGDAVEFRNSDAFFHNVFSLSDV